MTIIAEIGTAHGGNLSKAFELIDASKDAGADFVKFQWVYADEILYQLRSTNFSNEYWDMNNTERLKLLNEILKILGYYAEYDINGED